MYFMRRILRALNAPVEMLYVGAKWLFDRKVSDRRTNSALSGLWRLGCCLFGFDIFSIFIVSQKAEAGVILFFYAFF